MKYVDKVTNDSGEILAIILRSEHKSKGIEFFTPDEFPQQLGYMFHKKGHKVHNKVKRQVSYTFEVLFIKSGKVRVDFYNDNKTFLKSDTLNSGDVILLAFGAHGFEMLEDAEMIEVKQGPYAGDDDKTRFDPE
jgi:mannose-6-phosphate isomerase-like protein (cupin superfamily)